MFLLMGLQSRNEMKKALTYQGSNEVIVVITHETDLQSLPEDGVNLVLGHVEENPCGARPLDLLQ